MALIEQIGSIALARESIRERIDDILKTTSPHEVSYCLGIVTGYPHAAGNLKTQGEAEWVTLLDEADTTHDAYRAAHEKAGTFDE